MKKPHISSVLALGALAAVLAVSGWQAYTAPPSTKPAPKASTGMTSARAEQLCREDVQQGLKFPSSFSMQFGSMASAPKKDSSGEQLVQFGFTAKNGLGLDLPQKATCVVKASGEVVSFTSNR